MMHWSDFRRRRVPFKIRKCRSLRMPQRMNYWEENHISYENKRFIKSMPQWRFSCTGLKWWLYHNECNFSCAWIEPNKWKPYGQMLIGRGHLSDWGAQSIRWHLLNASFSINVSNITSDNYWRKSGLRQPVPEAHSPKYMFKWRLLQKKGLMGW